MDGTFVTVIFRHHGNDGRTAFHKQVAAYRDIAYRTGFIPPPRIVGNQYPTHRDAIEYVIFYHDLPACRHQNPPGRNTREIIISYFHFGCPCHILHRHILRRLYIVVHSPVQRQQDFIIVYPFYSLHACRLQATQRMGIHELHLIPFIKSLKTV